MSEFKIKLNRAGVGELLKSAEVGRECEKHARDIAARCGDGYETDLYTGRTRVNASVWPVTGDAVHDNYKNNTLAKAVRP